MKTKLWKKANENLRIRYSPFTMFWYLEVKFKHNWAAVKKSATRKGVIAHKHDYIRRRANEYLSCRGII